MSDITIFDPNGKITRWVNCLEKFYSLQLKDNEQYIEGYISNDLYYIDATNLIPVSKPNKPTDNHVFDYSIKQWIDPRTLEDFKILKWTEIKEQRSLIEFGTFTYNSMEFDGDINAQRRLAPYISISKSMLAASQSFTAKFILANNTEVDLNAQDFVNIELVKVQQVAEAFSKSANLRTQIDNSITIDDVNSITWDYSV